ncbi:hypothetical protein KIL84_001894, partial [Mauremys mutica]
MGAPQGYQASWWVYLLHQVPRTNFQFEVVESSFAPQDRGYQQTLDTSKRVFKLDPGVKGGPGLPYRSP